MLGSEHDDSKPFADEGYAFMAAVFEVHRETGGGLSEEIYQESLEHELTIRGISFSSKSELAVYYKGKLLNKRYIPDLIVHGQIVVELKAVQNLVPEHESQLLNYMRITRRPVGYLVNLASIHKVQWKRFVLSEFLESNPNAEIKPNQNPISPISVH